MGFDGLLMKETFPLLKHMFSSISVAANGIAAITTASSATIIIDASSAIGREILGIILSLFESRQKLLAEN